MGLPAPPESDIDSWEYTLVNHWNSIGEYSPTLAAMENGQYFDERAADSLNTFIAAARAQGLNVYLSSTYRTYADQAANFQRKLNQGYDAATAWTIVALPGTSEHQLGLAADITDRYYELKDSSLENTALFQWMSQNCQDYGFIVRYPKSKSGTSTYDAPESITGCIYEPWHFRYVGVEVAKYIMENGLCLEEFVQLYRDIYTAANPQQ
jgi:D-alanyl-D-alanine carboxypeptidase